MGKIQGRKNGENRAAGVVLSKVKRFGYWCFRIVGGIKTLS